LPPSGELVTVHGVAMIRIFAPPTRDGVLRPDAVTTTNFLLHVAVGVLLSIPLSHVVKQELLDRLVVFLVPPDTKGTHDQGTGDVPYRSAASEGGLVSGNRTPEATQNDQVVAHGAVPVLTAVDLDAANRLLPGDNALTVLEVDSAVARDPSSAAPEYPPYLLAQGIEGFAAVRWVVDSTGEVDTLTYRVVQTNNPDFSAAVRRALPRMRFRPAMQGGHRVRQLVEQTFRFRISAPVDSIPVRKPV
jgi:TonB family protein